jgi:hypothetical protein
MVLSSDWFGREREGLINVALRIIAAILLSLWLVLVLIGKGGYVHILLLNGIGVAMVEMVTVYRTRMSS